MSLRWAATMSSRPAPRATSNMARAWSFVSDDCAGGPFGRRVLAVLKSPGMNRFSKGANRISCTNRRKKGIAPVIAALSQCSRPVAIITTSASTSVPMARVTIGWRGQLFGCLVSAEPLTGSLQNSRVRKTKAMLPSSPMNTQSIA